RRRGVKQWQIDAMHYPAQHNHLVSEGSIFGGETNSRLQPAPRLEHVGEEHSERVQDRKHRLK
ncbi:MAG: hypothetical protein WCA25_07935, partial [Pseudolabrys sp.]